jgi:hypothetical protein
LTDLAKAYQATDDDLPDFIQGKADAPSPTEPKRPLVPATPRELQRERQTHERRIQKENKEAIQEGRKVYIKSEKKKRCSCGFSRFTNRPS